MTGPLRLSALLLLLLSRWASADLEKGEDEFVRSWVIIEEQLVPPSRDDPLAVGVGVGSGGGGGRRITPKSVFVAPSFNKCSDGYRPDSMGRCVKVVKLNQAAQWDFLLKQLNSMYGPGSGGGGGFPMPVAASSYQTAAPAVITTTTVEPPSQKTDSPGPFQLNIPFGGGMDSSKTQSSSEESPADEQPAVTTVQAPTTVQAATTPTATTAASTTAASAAAAVTGTSAVVTNAPAVVADDAVTTVNPAVTTTVDPPTAGDDVDAGVTATAVPAEIAADAFARPRPYRNRYQSITTTTTTTTEDDETAAAATTTTLTTSPYDQQPYSTTAAATDLKTKYVDGVGTSTVGTRDPPKTVQTGTGKVPTSFSSPPTVMTTTAVGGTETEEPTTTGVTATTESADIEEDVVTVLAMAASVDRYRPGSAPTRAPYTTGGDGDGGGLRTQTAATETATPEYYDDQPEEPTASPEPDCSAPNAYRYYVACAVGFQQQQQILQQQQQQLLLQQHQQQQQMYQQQQQQFYQQQQLQQHHQQQHQPPPPSQHGHVAAALVKRPVPGGSVQVRFPGDGPDAAESANLVRFPGPAPYRTTNKMYESSRHPTWWPTSWPEQQQQQQPEDAVRQQHHLPQQKPEVRLWEFGSRIPKTTSAAPQTLPPPPPSNHWFHRYF